MKSYIICREKHIVVQFEKIKLMPASPWLLVIGSLRKYSEHMGKCPPLTPEIWHISELSDNLGIWSECNNIWQIQQAKMWFDRWIRKLDAAPARSSYQIMMTELTPDYIKGQTRVGTCSQKTLSAHFINYLGKQITASGIRMRRLETLHTNIHRNLKTKWDRGLSEKTCDIVHI